MKFSFAINLAVFILSIIDCCVSICSLTYFMNVTGSLSSVNYLAAIFWLAMTVSDLPMGYIADRFGPKKIFLSAIFIRAIAFVLFFLTENLYIGLVLGNFFAGIAVAFMSNAFLMQIRLVEDQLKFKIDNKNFLLNNFVFKSLGFIIGCILSFVVIYYSAIKYIWLVSFVLSLSLLIVVIFFWDSVKKPERNSLLLQFKKSVNFIYKCPPLHQAIITNALLTIITSIIFSNWIVLFAPDLAQNPYRLVVAYAFFHFLKLTAAIFWKQRGFFKQLKINHLIPFFSVNIFLCSIASSLNQIILFIGILFIYSAIEVLIRKEILENIEREQSGTILSIYSLSENFTGTLGLLLGGYLLQYFTLSEVWFILGIISTGIIFSYKLLQFIKTRQFLKTYRT